MLSLNRRFVVLPPRAAAAGRPLLSRCWQQDLPGIGPRRIRVLGSVQAAHRLAGWPAGRSSASWALCCRAQPRISCSQPLQAGHKQAWPAADPGRAREALQTQKA